MPPIYRVSFEISRDAAGTEFLRALQAMAIESQVILTGFEAQHDELETPYVPKIKWLPEEGTGKLVPVFGLEDLYSNAKASLPNAGAHCITGIRRALRLGWSAGRDAPMHPAVHRHPANNGHFDGYISGLRADRIDELITDVHIGELQIPGVTPKSFVYLERVADAVRGIELTPPSVTGE